ncbi:IS66-like element accessory protein TnpA [Noviherbaspirillum galbum]|uniref:Transposase n=1 Tax=Noviherbaspirillum galbum TaxID=2709383 RepID=A0A6B3SGE7_9BURK|nr:transposase [Noviherbaspirillum galbum]NEX59934.1 transposase [Noviherbaspirillum galbum]
MSTIDIMDIMDRPVISTTDTKHYRRHSLEFKLALVKQTMQDGASVARIARENGVNANQVFAWRKLYREGALGTEAGPTTALLPVTLTESAPAIVPASASAAATGVIRLECANGSLTIEGVPDDAVLNRILERLLR